MAKPTDAPEATSPAPRLFGTFKGVFVPTLLTILGVIMYLRTGWTVGNGGLLGAWLIIALATAITLATGLSLSSIATNTRIGTGGPYAIISRSLGIEVGGSVGLPLYLSQALAVAMYIFGLREGWQWIFPDHPALAVDLVAFAVVFGTAYVSASFAFKVQYVILALIAVSLVLVFGTLLDPDRVWQPVEWWGRYPGSPDDGFGGANFWIVFAVFFPAATGIMAGANMSGELRDPRRSIPVGTLAAIAVAAVVYFALAFWASVTATPAELVADYNVVIDKSLWAPGVVAGVLGATYSSAVVSLVGAPRILKALSDDELMPKRAQLGAMAKNAEPRRALVVTGLIVLFGLLLRDLNAIAPLITMFFLITYFILNLVVLIEASLKLTSFRPSLRLPWLIPLVGAVGCVFAMFIVNPSFSLIAVGVTVAIFLGIQWSGVGRRKDDVRSGIFVAFAEWAAAKVVQHELANVRAWKPNLLVPVRDPAEIRGQFRLLVDMAAPEGSLKLLGLATHETVGHLTPRVRDLGRSLQKHDVFTTWSVIDTANYREGVLAGLQALGSAFFRPNVLFLRYPRDESAHAELREVLGEARRLRTGVVLLGVHDVAGFGRAKVVNLWVRPERPGADVAASLAREHLNLGILMAYRLTRAWGAELNVVGVVPSQAEADGARSWLDQLRDLCRLPDSAQTLVMVGDLEACIPQAPQSDMDIMALQTGDDLEFVRRMIELTRSSCLFTIDSGLESALA